MRRQLSCSKCGFACASTWRSLTAPKVVICNTCRSKEGKSKIAVDASPPNYRPVNEAVNIDQSRNSSFEPIMHENVALPIGMIFGNLPFEPTLAFPLIGHGKSQDPKVKSEVFTADDCGQRHFYCGKSSTTSALGDSKIQIKQEYDEEAIPILESNKIKKKKRSKLPQYTLSPLARFINQLQLQHVSGYGRRPPPPKSVADQEPPKYDDVLIYEKCKYVGENEVGLGAKLLLLPPPLPPVSSTVVIKEELSSTNESGDSY